MSAETIAQEWFETAERLHAADIPDTIVPEARWDDAVPATRKRLVAIAQDLLDRGVIIDNTPQPPGEREITKRGLAGERVAEIARQGRVTAPIDGWLVLYSWRERNFGREGLGIGAVSSGGEVWEAVRRLTEKQLAQHLQQALRQAASGLIVPRHG